MTKRPRFPEDLFEELEKKKEHPNENIADVLFREAPELEEKFGDKENQDNEFMVEDDLF